jgi:hypothetical protein
MIAWYANRAGYLMAIGRPAAQVGLYHPGNSIWMGGKDAEEADRSTTKLGWQLFEHQVDWDYFDEQSLSEVATLEDGGFKNLSGQVYKAIVLPSMTVITRTGLERLRAFAKSGGKVIFVGKTPRLILDRTFMDAKDVPDLSFATLIEPSGEITPQVLAALPSPDVKLDAEFLRLTYTHRAWSDGDMYYFFNESDKPESRMATIAGHGKAQAWDLGTGEIHPLADATYEGDAVRIPLAFGPYEAKVIVVGPLPKGVAAPEPVLASRKLVQELDGDWSLSVNGQSYTSPLKSWQDLGVKDVSGPGVYTKEFVLNAKPAGKRRMLLECANLRDYAHLRLNGVDLQARGWQPYRWDVTKALKLGKNVVEIEVRAEPPGRGPAPAPMAGMLGPVRIVSSE